ncbi:MAG: F-type H+-transporting ATPase subunit b [Rhodobacteraceae bacterium HLUCCA08]|nr:MAG: F-type H+-transporting ATPase subunit b [Rhodobacteraceae bacterium HLUCCA08]
MTFDPWTLGFQAVNVLVLVWLLHRFFWKPVAGMIAARQVAAATLLDKAEAARTEAEAASAEVTATRAGLAAERDATLATARKDAAAARDTLLAEARADAEALHDTAKAARVRAAETLKANAMEAAQGLAITIAGQLVARLDNVATDAAFLGWLVEGLAALPEAERAVLAGAPLEVVSAAAQDGAAQNRIVKAVGAELGGAANLTFRTDTALIAGHELHSPHFSLRNSWQADLARIAAALHEDAVRDAA